MDFNEINAAVELGLQGFQEFIQKKTADNKDYLNQVFWVDGFQMTVLNYLIDAHQDKEDEEEDYSSDLTPFILYVLQQSSNKNTGEPIHQALSANKTMLAYRLLEAVENSSYNFDQRDADGRTLISLILKTRDPDLLAYFLGRKPNVNAASKIANSRVLFQPLHQAVVMNFAEGVRLLAQHGAQLVNTVGYRKETPVLLAARLGKIRALEALLELPPARLSLESKNENGDENESGSNSSIEELCYRIQVNNRSADALKGVAMLLCCGAEPPQDAEMCRLLSSNREALLKVIHRFLENKPELVDAFVHRCHLKESALHNIIYANHSWGSSIRHLFGNPSDAALIVEDLVSRKYRNQPAAIKDLLPKPEVRDSAIAANDSLKLYAEFVRRYTEAYDSQRITNRWSAMRWMIAEGQCNWEAVLRYSENNPSSRTRIIIDELFAQVSVVHENVDGLPASGPSH